MASSVQRISSNTSALRAALAPWSRPFSSDALVEVHPGEIGMVSGIPEEHLRRKVVIYSPVRTATQQGSGKVGRWKINFVSRQKWENPLMGWTSTGDPYANVGDAGFGFDSEEAAKSFAEKHGWEYVVKKRQTPLLKLERIADPSPKFLQTKMSSTTTRFPTKSLTRFIELHRRPLCRSLCVAAETRTQRLERIADELLDLNKLERYDYAVLTRLRMGLNKYGAALSGLGQSAAPAGSAASSANEAKAAEKTAFDIKLDKFDASAKIKIIKEVRTFTDLGLKEAKDLVEKAPVVLKKGVTKEEADSIVAKLKELGATVVLE